MQADSTDNADGAAGGTDTPLLRPPSSASTRSRRSRSSSLSKLTFEEALKHLFSLEKKLREETAQNIRELKVHTTQKRIDIVAAKANYLYNVRQQLKSSKNLYKEEETIMREFTKMKAILAQKLDDDDWERAKGDCKFLGGKLNDVRNRQRNLSGQVEDLEDSIQDLMTSPMDDLDNYDLEQLKREEAEFDANVPSFSSYPLFNSAPYGRARAKPKPSEAKVKPPSEKHSIEEKSSKGTEEVVMAKEKDTFSSWLAKKEAELKHEQKKRNEDDELDNIVNMSSKEQHSTGYINDPPQEQQVPSELEQDLAEQAIPSSSGMNSELSEIDSTSSVALTQSNALSKESNNQIVDPTSSLEIIKTIDQIAAPATPNPSPSKEAAPPAEVDSIRVEMEILDAKARVKE